MKAWALLFGLVMVAPVKAQEVPRGVADPEQLEVQPISDQEFVRTLASIDILGEAFLGNPGMLMRVAGSWGEHAGLDGGAMTTRVFVVLNMDGYEFAAFELDSLLDPVVECMRTEEEVPVAYLSYGLGNDRKIVRIQPSLSGMSVGGSGPVQCDFGLSTRR